MNLWWIRRDLRLRDNQALHAAMVRGEAIVPVFILDPALLSSAYAGDKRIAFLFGGLKELDAELRERGSYLVVRQGRPPQQLAKLQQETMANAVFAEEDFSPYARRRDLAVSNELPLNLVEGMTIHHPGMISKSDGLPYTVFTPYSRRWKELTSPDPQDLLPAPQHIPTPPDIAGLSIPDRPQLPEAVPFPPGEQEAQRRLAAFAGADSADSDAPIHQYDDKRNRVDLAGTSRLSPYLRFGMLSARQAAIVALQKRATAPEEQSRQGAKTWLDELIWREFYLSILFHFPHVLRRSFRPEYDRIAWRNDEEQFDAWCCGRTGYPIVDAAMRQLVQSGWMHNRARMIVASFLVKDLLIDWRWGERWFMQHLVDGDPAANNGGWQWVAGTGTDAAPYFRIFNPVLQGKKFDPNGDFARHWLPELNRLPKRYVHEPWKMPYEIQRQTQCVIGRDYPQPIVDHAIARRETLDAYIRARNVTSIGG